MATTTIYSLSLHDALPIYLSAFFEATRRDYYDGLRGVTERGEWEVWLEYVLNGMARQAEDALSRAQRINRYLAQWRRRSEEHTSELQSRRDLVCRLLLEKK